MSLCIAKFSFLGSRLPLHGESAAVSGMSQEVRDALGQLLTRLQQGPVTLWGELAPDRALLDRARRHGALEIAAGMTPQGCVALPLTGVPAGQQVALMAGGRECLDLSLPCLRRVRAMVKMMKMEERRVLLVGDRDEAMTQSLIEEGVVVVADVDAALRIPFSPRFGVVAAPHLSGARLATVAAALRRRHPDSSQVVLDTRDPALVLREKRLLASGRGPDGVAIFSDAADASGRALYEAARFAGMEARHFHDPEEVARGVAGRRVVLATGLFCPHGVSCADP